MDVQAAKEGKTDMTDLLLAFPALGIVAPAIVVAVFVFVVDRFLPVPQYDVPAPTPATVPLAVNHGAPDYPTYCPACLCQWHEHNADWHGVVPAGDPILCDDHARRLSKSLDPRGIARSIVGMQHYGLREH